MAITGIPNWVIYPKEDWVSITPEDAGLDEDRFQKFIGALDLRGAAFGGEDHSDLKWGTVVTRGGYLLYEWGNRNYRFQTASVGKAFARAVFGLAVEDGLVQPDDLIADTWTGEGQLSHKHKYMTEGHHKTLTWSHMLGSKDDNKHYGGFPIELGSDWRNGPGHESPLGREFIPAWAKWTGDPSYDLYSHVEPGTVGYYSSGGFWRLGQALTALWKTDIKEVLDERIFCRIGIPSDRWLWYTGRAIQKHKFLYPDVPDAYTYLDPPYEIDGTVVRSAPGWVVISASDLARYGHLVATQGIWEGERLINPEWLRGHGGGNHSGMSGESRHYTAMGMVTTDGVDYSRTSAADSFLPNDMFVEQVRIRRG
jgi:CubicO group peptidase (beta-lactamase class C family)